MPDNGTTSDHVDDLMATLSLVRRERERLAEKITLMEDTIGVLRAELKRVSEELARRYE